MVKQLLKSLLGRVQASRRSAELERTQPHVDRNALVQGLRGLGLEAGDTVFMHSSLKSLGFVEGGVTTVIAALQEVLGPQGTLMLPTYYLPGGTILGTCQMKDYVFDKRVHGTNMGALPAAFLATPGVCRSIHPTHSVSALGRHARHLTEAHHRAPSVFGTGSPWQRFAEIDDAKVLGLGISMGPVTFYHLLEDTLGAAFPVDIWLDPVHELPCIDEAGQRCLVPVRAFKPTNRRIDLKECGDLRDYFAREFERAGLKRNGLVGEGRSWVIPAQGFLEHLKQLASENITVYSTPEQLAARPLPQ